MARFLSPPPKFQYVDADGNPLSGGKLFTYEAGTSTPADTYINKTGTLNSNPIILGVDGTASIFLEAGELYKFILKTAADVQLWSQDNIESGGGDTGQFVESVTGLNTDNTDPYNPIVRISVDGVTITGLGTPGSPLVANGGDPIETTYVDLGSGTSFTVDWEEGGWFKIAPSGNFSVSFSNTPPSTVARSIVIEIEDGEGKSITLPAGGTWGALGEPEFSPNTDLVTVGMRDASSTSFWMLAHPGEL